LCAVTNEHLSAAESEELPNTARMPLFTEGPPPTPFLPTGRSDECIHRSRLYGIEWSRC
jgi:hypothetical protein